MSHSTQKEITRPTAFPLALGVALLAMTSCGKAPESSRLSSTPVTKLQVDYTCEETSEATKWLEVGLRLTDGPGTVEAIVVEHDDDASLNNRVRSPILVKREKTRFTIDRSTLQNIRSVFTGSTIKVSFDQSMAGELTIISDGPSGRVRSKMDCFKTQDDKPRFLKFITKNNLNTGAPI